MVAAFEFKTEIQNRRNLAQGLERMDPCLAYTKARQPCLIRLLQHYGKEN